MKDILKILTVGFFLVFTVFATSSSYAAEELDILTGDEWIKLTQENKVMFISGIGHVVEFERHLMGKDPSLESKSFIPYLVQGLRGKPIKEVVKEIDIYYDQNPKELSLPVYHILVVKVAVPK
jgi:hypothetical protein